MADLPPPACVADALDARRARILEDWRERVCKDPSLDGSSEWTRKQLYDHFPDVLEDFRRILRASPGDAPAAEDDQFEHAHAHARTRWLQGFSLRAVIREWGHFNSAVVAAIASLRSESTLDEQSVATAAMAWSGLVNDQLTASALEYHRLLQAEAQTRADELAVALDRLRGLTQGRARVLGTVAESLRTGLSSRGSNTRPRSATASSHGPARNPSPSRAMNTMRGWSPNTCC